MEPLRVDETLLRRAALAPARETRGDADLNPDDARRTALAARRARPAAVLMPIVRRPEGLRVVLTVRPDTMRDHAGQIAFPGGKVDAADRSPLAAALREAREEIGLTEGHADVLGPIERWRTSTGYAITPFVALVDGAFQAAPQPGEVAAVFEAPLDFLMDPLNCRLMSREWRGVERRFWAMPWDRHFIWGATAGMLKTLADRIAAERMWA
ncbi:MAG: CoA pyrophosphatase [Rhodobacteraceae bacterium]|nr:MAG: CoA pyrophosphatase [Paracoccaceae bacterium]